MVQCNNTYAHDETHYLLEEDNECVGIANLCRQKCEAVVIRGTRQKLFEICH
jgi:hypothetical protein